MSDYDRLPPTVSPGAPALEQTSDYEGPTPLLQGAVTSLGSGAVQRKISRRRLARKSQEDAAAGPSPSASQLDVSEPGDAHEHEADRAADAMVQGRSFQVSGAGAGAGGSPALARRIDRAPENLGGNPAERPDAAGNPITSHRPPTVGDAANAPTVTPAPTTTSRAANVKVIADQSAPVHTTNPVCVDQNALYQEGPTVSPPPSGFTAVTGIQGAADTPIIEQEASKGIFINNQPTADDVQQGGIGDCYFMSVIGEMASRDPGRIKSIMAPDGNGGASVTLWRRQAHNPGFLEWLTNSAPQFDYIPVVVAASADLAVRISNNRVYGAQLRCAPQAQSQDYWAHINGTTLEVHRKDTFELARWAPLLEKAYARFAQTNGQYGGAAPGKAAGGSGYAGIDGGVSFYIMHVLYGEQADATGANVGRQNITAFPAPGQNLLSANAAVVDQLCLLAGRGDTAAPADQNAPILTANTFPDPQVNNLGQAITQAMADPDWANIGADRQTKITAVQTAITTWQTTAPDPPGTTGAKAAAMTAVGNACVEAARTPNTNHLNDTRGQIPNPIRFDQDSDVVSPALTGSLGRLGASLQNVISAGTLVPFNVNIVGHASLDGDRDQNLALSEQRATNVSTAIQTGRDATKMAKHNFNVSGVGPEGATRDVEWRRVDVTIDPQQTDNELLGAARSAPIRAMMDLVLNVRNLGTDSSSGQRNVYAGHSYGVVGVSFLSTAGQPVALQNVGSAQRAALFPQVDVGVSSVRLRNPHHGNEPDRTGMNQPTNAADGTPGGAGADGVFNMSLAEFFRNFNAVDSGVFPKT